MVSGMCKIDLRVRARAKRRRMSTKSLAPSSVGVEFLGKRVAG
jgi:hypothetical protein